MPPARLLPSPDWARSKLLCCRLRRRWRRVRQSLSLGDGGDAWTFEKRVEGALPDGGCDEILVASPRGTVQAWHADGRFGAVVPLQEGENEVRAICRANGADRSVSEPQDWRVRLRDAPMAWIRIIPAENGVALNARASQPAPARSAPIIRQEWRARPGNPEPLETAEGAPLGDAPVAGHQLSLRTPGVDGEYQITLRVTDALGRTDESTAAILVENGEPRAAELAPGAANLGQRRRRVWRCAVLLRSARQL